MKKKSNQIRRKITAGGFGGVLLGMALAPLAGCGGIGPGDRTDSGNFKLSKEVEDLTGQYQTHTDYGNVPVSDDFRESYVDFSLDLLKECRSEAGANPMVSPLSMMAALEMTRSGARGETEAQMAQTLYGEQDGEELSRELMAYLCGLPSQENARFHFANSIWFRNNDSHFHPDEAFLENCAGDYDARIYGAPFDGGTLHDINGWVEKETAGMIPDILDRISESAILYLINAVAFEARWQEPYTSNQVHGGNFYPREGESQTARMMYSEEWKLIRDGMARGFVKPYEEGYAFVALLPEEGDTVDAYLASLSGEKWMELLEQAEDVMVEAGLPKFTAETRINGNQVLKELGMPLAFDGERADFTGMGQSEDRNIYISRVIHSTFIQVDEQGTRAGAATVVEMTEGAAAVEPERVILDRPFLYAIVDTEQNLPIFLGIVDTMEE